VEEIIPSFSKTDIIEWVKIFYTNPLTVKAYLNILVDKQNRDINIPDFKNRIELNDEFFDKIRMSKYIKIFVNVMIKYIRENKLITIPFYSSLLDRMESIRTNYNDNQLLNNSKKTQEVLPINLSQIEATFDILYEKVNKNERYLGMTSDKVLNSAIIVGLYMQNAYRDDIGNIVIKPTEITDSMNYFDGHTIFIQSHKTSKTHGTLSVVLDTRVVDLIEQSIAYNPRNLLFEAVNGKISQKVTAVFSKLFGSHITINLIRKIHSSDAFSKSNNDAIACAKRMGHDLKTSLDFYQRKPLTQSIDWFERKDKK
jgi:hypothetical protein